LRRQRHEIPAPLASSSSSSLVVLEPLEPRALMHAGHEHFAANINFQPAGPPVPSGYLADVGNAYGLRGNGLQYGWDATNTIETRDRNSTLSPDQRYDTLNHLSAAGRWELAVPNGTYNVHLVSGDARSYNSVFKINVEGTLAVNGTPTSTQRWVAGTATVTVSDGRLTVAGAAGAVNNKLCFVDVVQVDEAIQPPPTAAPAAPTALDARAISSSSIELTWTDNATNEDGYQIYRRVGGSTATWYRIATVLRNTRSFTDMKLAANTSYAYRVRATNSIGVSAYSNTDTARTHNPVAGNNIAWGAVANAPIIRAEALRATVGGKLYVFGGFSGDAGPVLRSDVYDPATNTWTRIADLPKRITHAGVAVVGRDVYVAGGYVGIGTTGYNQTFGTREVWRFNVDTHKWTAATALPKALAGGGLVALGRTLHYFSGNDSTRKDVGDHYILNLDNLAAGWVASVPLPAARSHFGYAALGGKIYAVAGQTGNDSALVTTAAVHVWDPAKPTVWTARRNAPAPVSHISSSTFVLNGRIVVAGGETKHGTATSGVFAYDPLTDTWSSMSSLPAARFSGVADVINGVVYFTGGSSQVTTWRGVVS
jgi:N-acetylneuraminic acid mutarotase